MVCLGELPQNLRAPPDWFLMMEAQFLVAVLLLKPDLDMVGLDLDVVDRLGVQPEGFLSLLVRQLVPGTQNFTKITHLEALASSLILLEADLGLDLVPGQAQGEKEDDRSHV